MFYCAAARDDVKLFGILIKKCAFSLKMLDKTARFVLIWLGVYKEKFGHGD